MYKTYCIIIWNKIALLNNIANSLQQIFINSYRDMLEAWRESPARRLLINPKTLPISEMTQHRCSNNLNSWSPNDRFPVAKIGCSACTIGCLLIASLSLCRGEKINRSWSYRKWTWSLLFNLSNWTKVCIYHCRLYSLPTSFSLLP